MEHEPQKSAKVFQVLCDPNRLAILELLRSGEGRERAEEILKRLTAPYAERESSSCTCQSERTAI